MWIFYSDVTKILTFAAQAAHENVPPDVSFFFFSSVLLYIFFFLLVSVEEIIINW